MPTSPTPPTRIERVFLRVIAVGALLVAALAVVAAVVGTASIANDKRVDVTGMLIANAETPAFTERSDAITDARYDSVSATVTGLSGEARAWLVTEHLAATLLTLGLALVVAWVALRLAAGRPFVRSATVALGGTAIVVTACGLIEQTAAALGHAEVVSFLGADKLTAGGNAENPSYEGFVAFGLNLDLAPIGWGIALLVIASAFELGQRLQRDTEGLV
ncbi:hypothetical protein [Microcella sp.]|uniref:hypothetical protein n=1 Tax=Microcella sp. TaxID=1913979 RepID=UPI00256219AB|nr:hypothetical protein [Microcella sp.]MBX9472334.1 hypothetical protein [Microcella sp.]